MASRIERIVNAVHVELDAAYALQNKAPVDKLIGRLKYSEHNCAPAVAWIPVGGPIEPPKSSGGKLMAAGTGVGPTAERQNQIATRVCRVEAYCWSGGGLGELEALEATETLVHDLITAIDKATGITNVVLVSERWVTQEATRAGWIVDGQLCAVLFDFRIPIIGEVAPLTTIVGQDHQCNFNTHL